MTPMRLGQLEIHAELNEITGPAGSQRLEPQAMTVLELLAGEPGRVWSRDDLLRAAWAGRVVSDVTLTGVISRLRRALADAGVADVRIETRSKRGYLLIHAADAATAKSRRRFPSTRAFAAFGVMLAFAALAFGTWQAGLFRQELASLDGVRLDFDITFPDGLKSEPVIWLEDGAEGEVRLSGEHPLRVRVVPAIAGNGLLHLRIEATGLSHWTGFEQVIGLGTESHFTLQSEKPQARYDVRFVASLHEPPPGPQEKPR